LASASVDTFSITGGLGSSLFSKGTEMKTSTALAMKAQRNGENPNALRGETGFETVTLDSACRSTRSLSAVLNSESVFPKRSSSALHVAHSIKCCRSAFVDCPTTHFAN
jgi:hypothetical protein